MWTVALALALGLAPSPAQAEEAAFEPTPPRLAFVAGEASFLRPGAEGWAPAPVNLALAPGDRLATGAGANLELQVGAGAFLRAGENAELSLAGNAPDLLALELRSGTAALDLRSLPSAQGVALAAPSAAVAIAASGYYRLVVAEGITTLVCRRGCAATLTLPHGRPLVVASGEMIVVSNGETARYAAPDPDAWDLWNDERSDLAFGSPSLRYVSPSIYGASDLDAHGSWRTVAPYGWIWFPTVAADWAPYGAGRWLWHPGYGWTWLDPAPWGWAPFHYGRWIYLGGGWAWAPGGRTVRVRYAPALVAFYGSPRSTLMWVPLGWGEPCRPWWGPRSWIGRPHWLDWQGPRVTAPGHVNSRGVVAVTGSEFGRQPVERIRVTGVTLDQLRPVRGALSVERSGASFTRYEPRRGLERSVVPMPRSRAPRLGPVPRIAPPR